ncbi:MAG: DNRLRE domain-containing protein [bacterium]|nr:DNRLRE domain-containing protein [bacterium]
MNTTDPDVSISTNGRLGNGLQIGLLQGQYGGTGSGISGDYFLLSSTPGVASYQEEMYYRYYIKLDPNFPYVQGGKIPGLMAHAMYGGGTHPDGTNGWTARYMWSNCGELYLYAYLPDATGWGTDLKCDYTGKRAKLLLGKWHCIEQYIKLNTVGRTNGICKTWFDGNVCQSETNLLLRTADTPANKDWGSYFSCFYGGSGIEWAPPYDTYMLFDNVVLATNYIGPMTGAGVLPTPVITTAGGAYSNQVVVSVTGAPGATIRYTSNGEAPGYLAQVYTGPVRLVTSAAFKARAFNGDRPYSDVATASYTITHVPVAGSMTNIASDDSYVWQKDCSYPTAAVNNVNYGGETTVAAIAGFAGYERRGLVKFPIGNVTAAVASATLRLYVDSTSGGPGRITLLETNSAWSNTGVTWANRPGECELVAVPVMVSAAGWIEWDVSNYLSAQRHKGETELAFYLISLTSNYRAWLRSKEYATAAYRPQLIVNTTMADATPPAWITGWPAVDTPCATGFVVHAKINEAGAAYYVVLDDGAPAPSAGQVQTGQDAGGAPARASGALTLAANSADAAVVGALWPGTPYDVYFIAGDTSANVQFTPVKVDAITIPEPAALFCLVALGMLLARRRS